MEERGATQNAGIIAMLAVVLTLLVAGFVYFSAYQPRGGQDDKVELELEGDAAAPSGGAGGVTGFPAGTPAPRVRT